MLDPFVILLSQVIQLYIWVLIAWTIISVLISFKIINGYQPVVRKIMQVLDRLCEPVLKPIRKRLSDFGGVDISPIIVILLLNFVINALHTYFYNL